MLFRPEEDDMSEPIRVLQIVGKMERSGYESRIMDIYRNLDRDIIQFDFYTHRKEKGDFDDEISSLGGRIFYNNPISPLHFPRYLRELDDFFKTHKYDIVHSHLNSYSAWGLLAAKRNGTKVRIAHSRSSGFDPGWKIIFKRASKLIVNIPPTHRFACSKKAGIWLFGRAFEDDINSKVIPNAFNCDVFAYNPESREDVRGELGLTDEIALVSVGRISPTKNHEMILRIFKKFSIKYPLSKLFLFGDGELTDHIRNLADAMDIKEFVVFMGNRPDVFRYLNGMDLMLFPSKNEGLGTVALEAQCNGLPVLASDVLPEETMVTDLIRYRSLKDPVCEWIKDAESMVLSNNRRDYSEEMKKAGYDMKTNALYMQSFYLESLK